VAVSRRESHNRVFDTHAHVHDRAFDDDRAEVVERARAAGVARILTVGCDVADSERAIQAARSFGLQASIGIHPHEAAGAPASIADAFDRLRSETGSPVVAIGETGLDYYYDHSPRAAQGEVMRAQIRYARNLGLPLIFHQRDAFADFVAILRQEWGAGARGVVHCFTGDAEQAAVLTGEFGLLLGIGGVATFKNADGLRAAIRAAGLDRLVLETDAPYLAPVPHRGARNEPSFVVETAKRIAGLLDRPLDEVSAATTQTAAALFGP
jgi:TatD DNase family protein